MWVRAAVTLSLAMFACGPRTQAEQPEGSEPQQTIVERDGDSERDTNATCPRRFEIAMDESACQPGDGSCKYAQASCNCVPRHPCSGVDPGPVDVAALPHVWSCDIHDPKLLRADGCPAKPPTDATKCTSEGQVCHYSPYCGGVQRTARCVDRAWTIEQRHIDPPPSADLG